MRLPIKVEVTLLGQPEQDWLPADAGPDCDRKVNVYGLIFQCPTHGPEGVMLIERLDDLADWPRYVLTTEHTDPEEMDELPSVVAAALHRCPLRLPMDPVA